MSRGNGYHHGDLRNALIMAAVALIEERGNPDFPVSEAARRAGVSAAAPYRHFRDRDALLEAVSELCFIGLGEQAEEAGRQFPEGSRERILALGKTYLTYVTSRPAFYNLMWSQEVTDKKREREIADRPGFNTLLLAVEAWCRKHSVRDCDPLDLALKLWAMAHGLAVLSIGGQLEAFQPDANPLQMLETSTYAFLDGLEGRA